MPTLQSVVFSEAAPAALLKMLGGFARRSISGLDYLFCTKTDHAGHFLECKMVNNLDKTEVVTIQIPLGYVLAILDLDESDNPFGFVQTQ